MELSQHYVEHNIRSRVHVYISDVTVVSTDTGHVRILVSDRDGVRLIDAGDWACVDSLKLCVVGMDSHEDRTWVVCAGSYGVGCEIQVSPRGLATSCKTNGFRPTRPYSRIAYLDRDRLVAVENAIVHVMSHTGLLLFKSPHRCV
jgi:hypothetical protein